MGDFALIELYRGKNRINLDDLDDAPFIELAELKAAVDQDIARIRVQLENADSQDRSGEPINGNWYKKAKQAKSFLGNLSQAIQAEQTKRNSDRKIDDQYLLQALGVVLDPKLREKVLEKAKELAALGGLITKYEN